MHGNRGCAISSFFPKALWLWASSMNRVLFSMKMWKHEEPKDKQISSHCVSFTAIYMLMEMKTSSPRTAISVDIGTDHVIIAACIFSSWVAYNLFARIAGGFPSLYEWERAPPVRPVLCEQNWMLSLSLRYYKVRVMQCVGTDRQKHKSAPMAWRTKQNLVRATMWRRSVQCVCLPRVYIWNNEPERAKDVMWTALSSCGAPFLWWEE